MYPNFNLTPLILHLRSGTHGRIVLNGNFKIAFYKRNLPKEQGSEIIRAEILKPLMKLEVIIVYGSAFVTYGKMTETKSSRKESGG